MPSTVYSRRWSGRLDDRRQVMKELWAISERHVWRWDHELCSSSTRRNMTARRSRIDVGNPTAETGKPLMRRLRYRSRGGKSRVQIDEVWYWLQRRIRRREIQRLHGTNECCPKLLNLCESALFVPNWAARAALKIKTGKMQKCKCDNEKTLAQNVYRYETIYKTHRPTWAYTQRPCNEIALPS